jgi:hypothetical protein
MPALPDTFILIYFPYIAPNANTLNTNISTHGIKVSITTDDTIITTDITIGNKPRILPHSTGLKTLVIDVNTSGAGNIKPPRTCNFMSKDRSAIFEIDEQM